MELHEQARLFAQNGHLIPFVKSLTVDIHS